MTVDDSFVRGVLKDSFAFIPGPELEFDEFFQLWRAFFRSEEKLRYLSLPGRLSGYFPQGSERAVGSQAADPKQFFHYYKDGICPPELLSATNAVFDACKSTAITVGKSLDRLNLWESRLEDMVLTSEKLLLRVLMYSADGMAENFAASHTDIDLFTIIPAVQGEGLIVEQRNGSAQKVRHSPKTSVVLAGDMLELISGGQIHAARHRVARTEERARMSVTFFVNPNDDTLIDGTNTAGSLLSKRLQEMKS